MSDREELAALYAEFKGMLAQQEIAATRETVFREALEFRYDSRGRKDSGDYQRAVEKWHRAHLALKGINQEITENNRRRGELLRRIHGTAGRAA